jgi:glucosamine--fructose-6-phosphate aminotransferase (isomerizing)
MENELFDIPAHAQLCYEKNKGLILPEKVPYIGMGASYFAAVTLHYLGVRIFPEIANEYYSYINPVKQFENAVLISQSGRTTDVLNCTSCFKEYIAIVNDLHSPLANQKNVRFAVPLHAGSEWFSSTKTFINTLVVLYLGHGYDLRSLLESMQKRYPEFESLGFSMGEALLTHRKKQFSRCFILGSGPNVGTASQAALMLNESLKYPFVGMSLSMYEHGFKESANDSAIIVVNPVKSVMFERTNRLIELLRKSDAHVIELSDSLVEEKFSPFTSILPLFFMANYLSVKLGISIPFQIGNKITENL